MTPLSARLNSCAALLLLAAMCSPFGGVPSYGQADTAGTFREIVPGLLGRTRFQTDADGNRIEIIDLLVGPEKTSEPMSLSGGALLDVQGGEAALIVDGKTRRVKPGDVVSLAQNQTITIDNRRSPRSLVARLVLLSRPSG
jgi:hypothetical protein